jgi:hypothetical protein
MSKNNLCERSVLFLSRQIALLKESSSRTLRFTPETVGRLEGTDAAVAMDRTIMETD